MQSRLRQRAVLLVLFFALLVAIESLSPIRRFTLPIVRLAQPLERGLYNSMNWIKRPFHRLLIGQDTADKISVLESAVSSLGVDQARLQALEAENKELRSITGISSQVVGATIPVHVIGYDPRSVQDLMRVAGGRTQGITEGSAVATPAGHLVGIVLEVGESTSVFRLLRSRDVELPVRVPTSDAGFGVLESPESLSLTMRQIPKEANLAVGDVVITNTGFPGLAPGIPVGVVTALSSPPEQLWQEATVEPFAAASTLDIVTIIVVSDAS